MTIHYGQIRVLKNHPILLDNRNSLISDFQPNSSIFIRIYKKKIGSGGIVGLFRYRNLVFSLEVNQKNRAGGNKTANTICGIGRIQLIAILTFSSSHNLEKFSIPGRIAILDTLFRKKFTDFEVLYEESVRDATAAFVAPMFLFLYK